MKAKLLAQLHTSSELCLSGLQAGMAAAQLRASRQEHRSSVMVTSLPELIPSVYMYMWHSHHIQVSLSAKGQLRGRHERLSIGGMRWGCMHSHQLLALG